jgi:formamidopyrimidine-DNA glycosylase
MPELPEVQTIVDGLNHSICHQTIIRINVYNKKTLDSFLSLRLINQTIQSINRMGKYIVIRVKKVDLVVHLRMTGQFFYFKNPHEYAINPYDRVTFELSEGLLVFRDVRKFGTMNISDSYTNILPKLGKDPLHEDFTEDFLLNLLKSSSKIKAFLLKQDKIAGLGNIYVDESLFLSQIHPESVACHIPQNKVSSLHKAIIEVLIKGLKAKGTSIGTGLGNYKHVNGQGQNQQTLLVYGKCKLPCVHCDQILEKKNIAGRGTTFCASCQILY